MCGGKTSGNSYAMFEQINATGMPISYADFLMNYILENAENKAEAKRRCKKILALIYNDGVTKETQTTEKPKKLKKFLTALYNVTLPEYQAMPETVEAFCKSLERLKLWLEKEKMEVDISNSEGKLKTLEQWADAYYAVTDYDKFCYY